MSDRIKAFVRGRHVVYCASRERLINAGLATRDMFPAGSESWRGNGLFREPGEPLWSVQRYRGERFVVLWSACTDEESETD